MMRSASKVGCTRRARRSSPPGSCSFTGVMLRPTDTVTSPNRLGAASNSPPCPRCVHGCSQRTLGAVPCRGSSGRVGARPCTVIRLGILVDLDLQYPQPGRSTPAHQGCQSGLNGTPGGGMSGDGARAAHLRAPPPLALSRCISVPRCPYLPSLAGECRSAESERARAVCSVAAVW